MKKIKILKSNSIILGSLSPRRKTLLEGLGVKFKIINPAIEENSPGNISPTRYARRLALLKTLAVQKKINNPSVLIITADTIVILGNKILGKPKSKAEAIKMLTQLSDKTHRVITALCVMQGKKKITRHVITKVTLRKLNHREIRKYVDTGEPMDKAGAYAIQGKGSLLIKKIDGDYFNVVGLPIVKLSEMLKEFSIDLL